ncbi:type III-A CRISPR-associated RAMP protein Csm4 [Sphaerospermopsis torques-reginae]|uniref:CRISPR system Cms protein Csm4 n=1 Tax=Sphaerospermopsis torques-reginae ITEP-024 TaxID=984208 RepID=A0ABX8WU99_9CYAN|nr:type III-A CRISPR-associated RAMP protein Csm4 [Sphaerospermopsis torques-reginae]QYX29991.1 type III-A CRISPR-associated RAMP protein Csm4 [Sphaerospermopsis torques-reginae ITEP-024]
MSVWKLVKLNFVNNPAHFGELGIGMEETSDRIRSDSLFSAWVSNYARMFGKDAVEELLQLFPTAKNPELIPPFRISSTFIYREVGKDKSKNTQNTIYYLPRPLKFPINYPDDDLAFFKTYKKLNYLPLEIWQRWYQGKGFTEEDKKELENHREDKPEGKLAAAETFNYKKACKTHQLPKIAIDRVTTATNLYHTGFVQFASDTAGLYFLLELSPQCEKLANKLQAALHLLGEEGIGGERSSGAGRFTAKWLDLPEIWQKVVSFKGGKFHTLISLFWDSNLQPNFLENSSYEIQERGGWIVESQIRRQMVRMFTEGSVFNSSRTGKLVNVTPTEFKKHQIYRSGISLTLPINTKEEKDNDNCG